jgi:hypothetical protein
VTTLPKPDDIVYVPDTEDQTLNWKFHGGWAQVGRVLVGLVEDQEKVWVSVREFGALTFEWKELAEKQEVLQEQFNYIHAGPR